MSDANCVIWCDVLFAVLLVPGKYMGNPAATDDGIPQLRGTLSHECSVITGNIAKHLLPY